MNRFPQRAAAAADCGADERAFLAAEDTAEAGAGSRRSADDERCLLPVTTRRAVIDYRPRLALRSRRRLRRNRRRG